MELNRYFLQHPEMILGTMQEVTTQYGKDTACIPFPDSDLHELLTQAVRQLRHENVFRSNTQITDDVFPSNTPAPALPENMDVFHSNTSAEVLRPYSYTMQEDVYKRQPIYWAEAYGPARRYAPPKEHRMIPDALFLCH